MFIGHHTENCCLLSANWFHCWQVKASTYCVTQSTLWPMVYLHLTPFLWACVFSNEHSLCRCFVFQSNGKPAGLFIQCPRLQLTKKKHEEPTGKRKARKTRTSNLHCNEKEQSVNACLAQKELDLNGFVYLAESELFLALWDQCWTISLLCWSLYLQNCKTIDVLWGIHVSVRTRIRITWLPTSSWVFLRQNVHMTQRGVSVD